MEHYYAIAENHDTLFHYIAHTTKHWLVESIQRMANIGTMTNEVVTCTLILETALFLCSVLNYETI